MTTFRTDETWHRLLEWTAGQAPSERLAAQILSNDGFESIDPSHPLGGKDGGKDALCHRLSQLWAMAVYFPRSQHPFAEITAKFNDDLTAAKSTGASGFVFVTNQELRLAEREQLRRKSTFALLEIYHLERITVILDCPAMHAVRKQYLGIDYREAGGGDGGLATAIDGGEARGGKGGAGSDCSKGGRGGDANAVGAKSRAWGGDGGNGGSPDGRGGRRTRCAGEVTSLPSYVWGYGYGGAGADHPEYQRRLSVLIGIRQEYREKFPHDWHYIEAGIDVVPVAWVNTRLSEIGENWRVEGLVEAGYVLPRLID
jgi:hypothetical protein